jgi:glucosamine--fructose-6-phosphate aminotransferase (isomerizing)
LRLPKICPRIDKPRSNLQVKQGESFVSETDTEVIPKLCRYVYKSLLNGTRTREGLDPHLTTSHDDTSTLTDTNDALSENTVPFPRLIMAVLKRLEGAYAILVRSSHYPGEVVACKRGSPLIFGLGKVQNYNGEHVVESTPLKQQHVIARPSPFSCVSESLRNRSMWAQPPLECWIASDASAVIENTNKVVVLEDGDVLHVCGGGWGVYNMGQPDIEQAVPRALQTLEMEVEHIMKGGYDHYMQKEIHEQPESLIETMRGRVPFAASGDSHAGCMHSGQVKIGGLAPYIDVIRRSRRIVFVACGTSYHACLAARSTLEQMTGVAVVLELASDLMDRQCPIFRDDTCVFVSQSGETADTLQALHYAKSRGALCVGVTNTVGSAISRATDCGIHQNAGYEIGVASTKAYTSQIVCITMMAVALSTDSIAKREQCEHVVRELGALPTKIRAALRLDNQMRELAEHVNELAKTSNSLLFFGRGANYATALEAALKMKEVALIHSEGILAGEMKHGPLALVDETLPIIVIATGDNMYGKMRSVVQQLLARGAQLVIVCDESDEEMGALARDRGAALVQVPKTCDALQPVISIIPMQLLSYHLTVLRGLNVDQPRNLAKSVTVAD